MSAEMSTGNLTIATSLLYLVILNDFLSAVANSKEMQSRDFEVMDHFIDTVKQLISSSPEDNTGALFGSTDIGLIIGNVICLNKIFRTEVFVTKLEIFRLIFSHLFWTFNFVNNGMLYGHKNVIFSFLLLARYVSNVATRSI